MGQFSSPCPCVPVSLSLSLFDHCIFLFSGALSTHRVFLGLSILLGVCPSLRIILWHILSGAVAVLSWTLGTLFCSEWISSSIYLSVASSVPVSFSMCLSIYSSVSRSPDIILALFLSVSSCLCLSMSLCQQVCFLPLGLSSSQPPTFSPSLTFDRDTHLSQILSLPFSFLCLCLAVSLGKYLCHDVPSFCPR